MRLMMTARRYGMTAVWALLVTVFTLSHSGKFHIVDEVSLFALTESVALRGALDTNTIAWTQWVNSPGEVLGAFGEDGTVYSKKGPAPALLAVPWYWLLRMVAHWDISIGLLQGTLLWNVFVTAATALLLWAMALRLGYGDRTGAALALLFGFGTIAWPYANQFFGEPLSAFALLLTFLGLQTWLYALDRRRAIGWMVAAGVGAGLALATVTAHALLIGLLAVYGLGMPWWDAWQRAKRTGEPLRSPDGWIVGAIAFGAPLVIAGGLLLWYNLARFGSPFDTGYHFDQGEGFSTPLWQGLWGLLVSPYRGFFWFTPLFIASLVALPGFVRRHPREAAVSGAMSVVLILLYSLWWMWWGGFAWGPRFLVPLAPFWVLWLAPVVEGMVAQPRGRAERALRWVRAPSRSAVRMPRWRPEAWALIVLAPISVLVQVGSVVVNWVNFEILLRGIYPTDWRDPLAFGPPAQSLRDLGNSPVIGQFRLMQLDLRAHTDLAWFWSDGNVQRLLLLFGGAVLLTLIGALVQWWVAMGKGAKGAEVDARLPARPVRSLLVVLPLLMVMVWLSEASRNPHYGDPDAGYRAIVRDICRQADGDEVLITVAPFAYQIPMNWLGGECRTEVPVVGLAPNSVDFVQGQQLLEDALAQHNQVWLVTGGVPPNDPENTVERWLAGNAYKANDTWYGDFRLVEYGTATQLRNAPVTPLDVTLVGAGTSQITLISARSPAQTFAGRVLPVEVTFRLSDENALDLRWFVQLLRPEGFPAALVDTAPEAGYRPFSTLPAGTDLVERTGLVLQENLPPGRYELIAGLYNPSAEGAPRLRAPNGSDFVRLGVVVVQ